MSTSVTLKTVLRIRGILSDLKACRSVLSKNPSTLGKIDKYITKLQHLESELTVKNPEWLTRVRIEHRDREKEESNSKFATVAVYTHKYVPFLRSHMTTRGRTKSMHKILENKINTDGVVPQHLLENVIEKIISHVRRNKN
jgi:hypothetical protein